MGIKRDKPDGYYEEIDFPYHKKDDLKSVFKDYQIKEHTNNEKGFEYLEDNDSVLEIINPYQSENLSIELSDCFSLFFNGWHSHYSSYEYDYSAMKKDALAILNGDHGVLCFFIDGTWLGSTLVNERVSLLTSPNDLVDFMDFPKEHLQEIKKQGVSIFANYWKPEDSYEFTIPKVSNPCSFSFPRRFCIRFVVRDGKSYGCGGIKRYDEQTSFLYFDYVDGTDDDAKLRKELIKHLEEDARKTGSTRVFVNVSNESVTFYDSLGYSEIEIINDAKVVELQGAHVVFDKTMAKKL